MYDTLRTFSCIIRVFYFFCIAFTVHLCAIVTRFNKCNLLTCKLPKISAKYCTGLHKAIEGPAGSTTSSYSSVDFV